MADDSDYAIIYKTLGGLGSLPRVARVVLRIEYERDFLPSNGQPGLVDFFHGKTCTVLEVFALMCKTASKGRDVTDFDGGVSVSVVSERGAQDRKRYGGLISKDGHDVPKRFSIRTAVGGETRPASQQRVATAAGQVLYAPALRCRCMRVLFGA